MHQDTVSQTVARNIGSEARGVLNTILLNIYLNDMPGRLLEGSRFCDTINDTPYLDDTKNRQLIVSRWQNIFSNIEIGLPKKNINIRTI